jgi:hypothetical protein
LFLWWALDGLRGMRRAIWIVRPDEKSRVSIQTCDSSQMQQLVDSATVLSTAEVAAGSRQWRAYASGHLDRLGDIADGPDWISVPRTPSLLFPRRVDGRLLLSAFDTALLGSFRDWCRPVEIVSKDTVEILFFAFGDLFIEWRARQWAASISREAALEMRVEAGNRGPMTRHAYRLTPHGRHLLEEGIKPAEKAPSIEVGGAVAYAQRRPWYVVDDGTNWGWRRERSGG